MLCGSVHVRVCFAAKNAVVQRTDYLQLRAGFHSQTIHSTRIQRFGSQLISTMFTHVYHVLCLCSRPCAQRCDPVTRIWASPVRNLVLYDVTHTSGSLYGRWPTAPSSTLLKWHSFIILQCECMRAHAWPYSCDVAEHGAGRRKQWKKWFYAHITFGVKIYIGVFQSQVRPMLLPGCVVPLLLRLFGHFSYTHSLLRTKPQNI